MTDAMCEATTSRRAAVLTGLRQAVLDERDGPLPAMLVALTMLAGVVDAASFLRLGGVFVATVTGNLVFAGLALAGAHGFAVLPCVLAIAGFVAGAFVGGRVCSVTRSHRGRALRDVVGVKLALAAVVTVFAVASGGRLAYGVRDAMIVLLAMSMGTQLAAIRYLKVPDLPTAALTLTITGAVSERGLGPFHPAVLRRIVAMLAFAAGAVSGAVLVLYVSLGTALGLGLAIIVGVAVAAQLVARSSGEWTAPSGSTSSTVVPSRPVEAGLAWSDADAAEIARLIESGRARGLSSAEIAERLVTPR